MHFFWDNRGRKDIIGSFRSDVFEPRTSTGSEAFSILNCLDAIKFVLLRVFTLIETICANICLKSRLKSAKVHVRLTCVTQHLRSLNSLITARRADGRTGRLIPNFFRVVQILLNIVVKVSLKDYWHLPKKVDYSLPLSVFVLGQSLTLFMLLCILNDPVIQRWSCIFVHPPPPLFPCQ